MSISKLIPDPDVLLAMAPEELAGPVLICLIQLEDSGTKLNRYSYSVGATEGYPGERQPENPDILNRYAANRLRVCTAGPLLPAQRELH